MNNPLNQLIYFKIMPKYFKINKRYVSFWALVSFGYTLPAFILAKVIGIDYFLIPILALLIFVITTGHITNFEKFLESINQISMYYVDSHFNKEMKISIRDSVRIDFYTLAIFVCVLIFGVLLFHFWFDSKVYFQLFKHYIIFWVVLLSPLFLASMSIKALFFELITLIKISNKKVVLSIYFQKPVEFFILRNKFILAAFFQTSVYFLIFAGFFFSPFWKDPIINSVLYVISAFPLIYIVFYFVIDLRLTLNFKKVSSIYIRKLIQESLETEFDCQKDKVSTIKDLFDLDKNVSKIPLWKIESNILISFILSSLSLIFQILQTLDK